MSKKGATMVETFATETDLMNRLIELSIKEGGAWTFSVVPFSHVTRLYQAASPSRLPDWLMCRSDAQVAYRGKIRGFSPAAVIREQNRGITCE